MFLPVGMFVFLTNLCAREEMSSNICSKSVDTPELSSQQPETFIKADRRKDYLGAGHGKCSTLNQ